jgi:Pentapeptide repeats (9 copies)
MRFTQCNRYGRTSSGLRQSSSQQQLLLFTLQVLLCMMVMVVASKRVSGFTTTTETTRTKSTRQTSDRKHNYSNSRTQSIHNHYGSNYSQLYMIDQTYSGKGRIRNDNHDTMKDAIVTTTARILPLVTQRKQSDMRKHIVMVMMTTMVALLFSPLHPVHAAVDSSSATATSTSSSSGASSAANAKLITGGASTLQSGRTISITRGVNLDRSIFANQNLKGVAFQQSVVRDADFSNCNLVGASFFDATVDGSNFNNADMTLANIEMAQFNRASMLNTVAREMYVSGATLLEGIATIENSDWTDTYLRADQQKYLCQHPTAKGVNPITGVSTRESLLCKD